MRGRKTLVAACSIAGLMLGSAVEPEAALPTGFATGFLAWVLTARVKEPVVPGRRRRSSSAVERAPQVFGAKLPPPPVPVRPPAFSERSDATARAEFEHVEYAERVVSEAVLRGLIDAAAADRIGVVIQERRDRATRAALAPADPKASPVVQIPAAPRPAPVRAAVPEPAAPRRPSAAQANLRRIKDLVASDVAVHGLAYLGVLLLFAGTFGFTLFSFNTVRVGLRPVAEIGMPGMLLTSAWFLRRKGAPVVATGVGLIGGLLLPVMLFASFVDGVAFPPELEGAALALALASVAVVLAVAYALYTVHEPAASLRYLVAPMAWFACWAVGLLLSDGSIGEIDLRRWTTSQMALVSVGVAATAAVPRLWPRLKLSGPIRTSAVAGIAIAYALTISLAATDDWPAFPMIVAGLAALVTVELLDPRRAASVAVALLQAAILAITASALVAGLGYAMGGAITAFVFLALLEAQEVRRRSQLARAVSGIGVAVGLGLATTDPLASVVTFGGVTTWAHIRRAFAFTSVTRPERWVLDGAAALLPLGAAWGLLQVWPDDRALAVLAGVPLAAAAAARALRSDDAFYAWWIPVAATGVIAGTVVVRTTEPPEPLAAAAALAALAIALSPRWPAARVWAAAGAAAWAAELTIDAADVAFRYRTVTWSIVGLALVAAASIRRPSRVAGHVAGVGTSLTLAGLVAAPTEHTGLLALGVWATVWLVAVVDQERGGAPIVDLVRRVFRDVLPAAVERFIAAVPALVLLTSLAFLASAAGRLIGPVADHRSWSGVILATIAVCYAIAARSFVSRRPLSIVLAFGAFVLSAVGIAVAAPDPWPSIETVSALIVAVLAVGGALRRPIMTWVAWVASGVLVVLFAGRAGVPARDLPWALLGWGAVLTVGGLLLDDLRSGRRAPGQGLRQARLAPPVLLGALAVPVGLAFAFTRTTGLIGVWSLAAAALYTVMALQLRAGSVSAVSYALVVVGVGAPTDWSVLSRPWIGGIWAAAFAGASLVLSRTGASRDPWLRWDVAPLAIAHGVAVVALARSLDVGMVSATWGGIGALALVLAGVRRNPFWAGAGTILLGVGAGAAGPGWLASALAVDVLVAAVVASRSHGMLRLGSQVTSMVLAAASWSQVAVWAGWSGSRTAMLTAILAAGVAVVAGAASRWAGLAADWTANLGGLSVAGGLTAAALSSAWPDSVDPRTAALLALVTASLSVGTGLAARPLGVDLLREASVLLAASAGLLLGYARELEPGPLTGWWAMAAIASTLGVLGLRHVKPSSAWVGPLMLLGVLGSVVTVVVAASALPRRDLLVVAFSVAGVQTAALGIAFRRSEPLYLSPLLFCGAWLLFASEALTGEAQWFTVPIGVAMLSVVGFGRMARRQMGTPVLAPELLVLEYVGMAFVVGDGLVESVVTSPWRGLFALAFGAGLAVWGALTKVRRRALFGACAALLAVALMVGGPLARLVPEVTGPALWVVLAAAGVALIAIATGLERGRERVAAAMRRIDTLTEGWE
jgi:hypothetical protein